jgi:hypothetical protein
MNELSEQSIGHKLASNWLASPTVDTWDDIQKELYEVDSESSFDFSNELVVLANATPSNKNTLIQIFSEMFLKMEQREIVYTRSSFEEKRINQSLDSWGGLSKPDKYRQTRAYVFNYCGKHIDDIYAIFDAWIQIDSGNFWSQIGKSNNPILVVNAIHACHADRNFEAWKVSVQNCPDAFDKTDGKWDWNDRIILIALLKSIGHLFVGASVSSSEWLKSKDDVAAKVNEIVSVISNRTDATPLLWELIVSCMCDVVKLGLDKADDTSSPVCHKLMLIQKTGELLKTKSQDLDSLLIYAASPFAGIHPDWAYLCILGIWLQDGNIDGAHCQPFVDAFISSFKLGFCDWDGDKGEQLRQCSDSFLLAARQNHPVFLFPSGAASLLADLFVKTSGQPVDKWDELWSNLFILREIVEFNEKYANTSDAHTAANLLLFVFTIGLAMRDVLSSDASRIDSASAFNLRLYNIAKEFLSIDHTRLHDRFTWETAFLHLATRQFIEEMNADSGVPDIRNTSPTITDFLLVAQNNPILISNLLMSFKLQNPSPTFFVKVIKTTDICISDIIKKLKQLEQLNPRNYQFDLNGLEALDKELAECFPTD